MLKAWFDWGFLVVTCLIVILLVVGYMIDLTVIGHMLTFHFYKRSEKPNQHTCDRETENVS